MTTSVDSVLSDDLLKRCMERAPGYDRDNSFCNEDFKELKEAGYLLAAVPKELGGLGLNLAQVCQEQRRLGYHAAATALSPPARKSRPAPSPEPLAPLPI